MHINKRKNLELETNTDDLRYLSHLVSEDILSGRKKST